MKRPVKPGRLLGSADLELIPSSRGPRILETACARPRASPGPGTAQTGPVRMAFLSPQQPSPGVCSHFPMSVCGRPPCCSPPPPIPAAAAEYVCRKQTFVPSAHGCPLARGARCVATLRDAYLGAVLTLAMAMLWRAGWDGDPGQTGFSALAAPCPLPLTAAASCSISGLTLQGDFGPLKSQLQGL